MNLAVSLAASVGLLATLGAQDSVQLKDGRFVMDKKMTRDAKGVTVHFENGDIFIPAKKILSTTALNAAGVSCSTPDGHLRFAPHWPNALAEVDRVLAAVVN